MTKNQDRLFEPTEEQDCKIFFHDSEESDVVDENSRVFLIIFNNAKNIKFYFQANEEMLRDEFSNCSLQSRVTTKEDYFSKLSIMKEINGLTRLITINVNFEDMMNRVN